MGVEGYRKLVKERKENFTLLMEEMDKLAERHGERLLVTRGNRISIGE